MRSENDVLFPGSLENSDVSEIKTKKWTVEYNLNAEFVIFFLPRP